MDKKYKIIGILGVILSILILAAILSAGSMIIDSPILVILATIDFIGTENEFRDLVESTDEAKLFREKFPDATTQYYLELGKRTIEFSNKRTQVDTTMHFKQLFDRTMFITYWCDSEDGSLFGHIISLEEMKLNECFLKNE